MIKKIVINPNSFMDKTGNLQGVGKQTLVKPIPISFPKQPLIFVRGLTRGLLCVSKQCIVAC